MGKTSDSRERRDALRLRFVERHQNQRRCAVIQARRITSRHRAVLCEGGAKTAKLLRRRTAADVLVLVEDNIAFAILDRDRRDFRIEIARLLGGCGFLLRTSRKRVLLFASHLVLLGQVLSRLAHVIVVERIPKAINDHRVSKADRTHLGAVAHL